MAFTFRNAGEEPKTRKVGIHTQFLLSRSSPIDSMSLVPDVFPTWFMQRVEHDRRRNATHDEVYAFPHNMNIRVSYHIAAMFLDSKDASVANGEPPSHILPQCLCL